MNVRLYVLQRATAAIMAPLVLVHLATILYATRHGLSAADLLARTRGSIFWALFYGVFVLAAATHASIGVRAIAQEWLRARRRQLDAITWGVALVLLVLGLRAVVAVVQP